MIKQLIHWNQPPKKCNVIRLHAGISFISFSIYMCQCNEYIHLFKFTLFMRFSHHVYGLVLIINVFIRFSIWISKCVSMAHYNTNTFAGWRACMTAHDESSRPMRSLFRGIVLLGMNVCVCAFASAIFQWWMTLSDFITLTLNGNEYFSGKNCGHSFIAINNVVMDNNAGK